MGVADTNAIIRAYLITQVGLTDLVDERIYCPRLPENAELPALGFFTRGGTSNPYIPGIVRPSVQFDCWADGPIEAREVYRAIFDALQGIQGQNVTIGAETFKILGASEEVQGQDLQDIDIPERYRVLAFFSVLIRAE